MKSFIPDINVWIALTYNGHVHHEVARAWFDALESGPVFFCRVTQLGFLRLLTNTHVMGSQVRGQVDAWRVFDRWFDDERIAFLDEPPHVEPALRKLTQSHKAITNTWPDAYLAAVAKSAGLQVVTLDRGLGRLAGADALVLQA